MTDSQNFKPIKDNLPLLHMVIYPWKLLCILKSRKNILGFFVKLNYLPGFNNYEQVFHSPKCQDIWLWRVHGYSSLIELSPKLQENWIGLHVNSVSPFLIFIMTQCASHISRIPWGCFTPMETACSRVFWALIAWVFRQWLFGSNEKCNSSGMVLPRRL